MKKADARAIARPAAPSRETAEIWTAALWLLAAACLLATMQVY
jgi:hypothetical protein